ncbi:ligand-binding sensor domain-containing protein [Spirosoma montaniterrae]|nr:sensor histidine kinase [Spirosoma montaniterrae]
MLFCCLLAQNGHAQMVRPDAPTTFRVEHIGVNDGLTQGSVYVMHKDSRNFLWFGTQDGLNRYDGHRFRTFRPIETGSGTDSAGTIRGSNIFGLIEDPDGNLWIGTEEGLNRYDRQRDRFDLMPTPAAGPRRSRVLPFYVDKTELLYLSDVEGLVSYRYRSKQKTILSSEFHPSKEYDLPSSAVRMPNGDIWLHAPKGLVRYNSRTKTTTRYFSDYPDNSFGPATTVFSFYIDKANIVWMGCSSGLFRFDPVQHTVQAYQQYQGRPISAVYSIAPDQRGRLWLGTQHDGVLFLDTRSQLMGQISAFTNIREQLNNYEISKIYVDNTGLIWANTDPNGLARIIPDAFLFGGLMKQRTAETTPADQQLSNYSVRGFMEERFDRIWVATEGGIDVVDPRANRVVQRYLAKEIQSDMPMHHTIKSVYRDPQRRIWVGTPGGVMAFDPKTQRFDPIRFSDEASSGVSENYVRVLVGVNDTLLIAGTEDGLYGLNPVRRRLDKLPILTGRNIFNVWFDAAERQLWVGTYLNGFFRYQLPTKPGEAWKLIQTGLDGYMVLHLRPDTLRQVMWLATDRGLAACKLATGKVKLYTERQGLANSFVYGSLADLDNNVWMSTNRGIARLDPNTGAIKNFMLDDGLQGYEYNGNAYLRTASGELYFGGVNGFNRFRPDHFRSSSLSPSLHIYNLTINEEPFQSDQYIGERTAVDLDNGQNTLAMEFAAIDFISNGRNMYQYQLVGYDPQWVMAGERNYVRYANLPPGNYTFQVRAANMDGHWSSRVRKLVIHINAPFWQQWPFLLLTTLGLGLIILAWVRQRENAIRNQQASRLRLAYDIQEQVKRDIARDLHDEIGTRLATIKLYTTQLTQQVGETPPILSLKSTIFGLINDTIGDVRNLLRKLNPATLEQHGYVAAVEELFSRINASSMVRAQMVADEHVKNTSDETAERLPKDIEVMLYRITQELVSNSLKHANAHFLELRFMQQADRILLNYLDDGVGFDYDRARRNGTGLGLGNIESRVALLNGRVTWQSEPDHGTRVLIDIPLGPLPKRRFYESLTDQPNASH